MYKLAVFGAGQAGLMLSTWIPSGSELLCFIDNNEEKQGSIIEGTPVVSPDAALLMGPDEIILAVVNKEAKEEIKKQLAGTTYKGTVTDIDDIKRRQDIRLAALRLSVKEILKRDIKGDTAELGVYKGELSREINRLLPDRRLWLFDTFTGFDKGDLDKEREISGRTRFSMDFSDTDAESVRERLPFPDKAVFVKGVFPASLDIFPELKDEGILFSLVSLDPDLYMPAYEGLKYFYPRLSKGGRILIHDYTSFQFEGVKKAVDKFCEENDVFVVPLMDLHGTAVLIKS